MAYAVLGTGLMGSAVARALLAAGHEVSVWNRTGAKAQALAGDGASVHADVLGAIAEVDAVIVLLLDHDAAMETLQDVGQAIRGKCVINLMTGTPSEATSFQSFTATRGARYLDGAVECYPSDIGSREALINCSGDTTVWTEHAGALRSVAGRSTFVGESPGAANVLDAALAGTFHSVALGALCEAFAFLRANGVDPSSPELALDYWLDFLKEEALAMAASLHRDEFSTTDATISVYLAAVRQWRRTMLETGQRASLMTAHLHNLELAEAAGLGDLGFIAQVTSASAQRP